MSNITIIPFLNRAIDLIINPLITLLFLVATAYAFYNTIVFLSLEAGDKRRDEAWKAILWGILGMVIMFSVYGILHFVLNSFGIRRSDLGGAGNFLNY